MEIDFGSSWRKVRVSEGSSYRQATVFKNHFGFTWMVMVVMSLLTECCLSP